MNFDRLARWYPWMERGAAGGLMQRCRIAFLDRISPPRRVLLAGEGPGRFLAELTRRFPEASVTVVDSSERMLDLAKRNLGRKRVGRVEFVHADVLEWEVPKGEFDLIVTHFFLDGFRPESLGACVTRLATTAAPEADWLMADFQIAEQGLARIRGRAIVWLLYRFFRITCRLDADRLTDPSQFLNAAGFELRERRDFDGRLLKSEWWRSTKRRHPDDPAWQAGWRK